MSDQDRRGDGAHEDGDAPPMLVIGERGPEVEDTTLEELRRQREELLRERAEAEARIRAERERAEAELEAERRRTEQELIERQRRIDDAERDLMAAERRVRRQAERSGKAHTVPRVARTLPPRGRLRAKGTAGLLVGVVAVSAAVALVSAGTPPSEGEISEYTALAEGQVAWDEATRAYDELIALRMQEVGSAPSDEGIAAVEEQSQQVLTLVEGAEDVVALPYSTGTDRLREAVEIIATDESPGAIRPVNQWEDQRYLISDAAVGRSDVERVTEAMLPGSALAWWAMAAMLLALAGLIRLAVKDRAYVALALLGVGAITGVASMVYLSTYQQVGSLSEAATARDEVGREYRATVSAQGRDLATAFGLDRGVSNDADYWTRDYYLDLEDVPEDVAQNYWDVRAGFADLTPEEQLAQAPALIEALAPVWDQRREQLSAADAAVVEAADDPPSVAALLLTSLATVGLALAAVLAPSGRPEQLRTSSGTGSPSPAGAKRPADRKAKGQDRRDSRTARGNLNTQARNTHRNTPARGRTARRGGRR